MDNGTGDQQRHRMLSNLAAVTSGIMPNAKSKLNTPEKGRAASMNFQEIALVPYSATASEEMLDRWSENAKEPTILLSWNTAQKTHCPANSFPFA